MRIAAADAGVPLAIFSWLVALSIAGLGGCALGLCHRLPTRQEHAKREIVNSASIRGVALTATGAGLCTAATDEHPHAYPGSSPSPTGPGPTPQPSRTPLLGQLVKLEYERNCFQRAESRGRSTLLRLQTAVAKTIKAAKRVGQNTSSGP